MTVEIRRPLPAPLGRRRTDDGRAVLSEKELSRFYRAVALARTRGAFGSPHGPLEATAWLHVTANLIESMEDSARRATRGDVSQLASFMTMVDTAPTTTLFNAGLEPRNRKEQSLVRPSEPVGVVLCGAVLDRLHGRDDGNWAHKSFRLCVLGISAIEQALLAARAYQRREIDAATFEDAVEAANTHRAPTSASLETEVPSTTAPRPTHRHDDQLGGDSADHSETKRHPQEETVPRPPELNPLETTLGRSLAGILDAAAKPADVPELFGAVELVIRRLPRAFPGKDVPVGLLATAWPELERAWRDMPLHAPEPERLPPREDVRDTCTEGRPQDGGRWEIASVNATETAASCPPSQAIDDLSGRVYGLAGASLIRAQNEWVNAKECFSSPDTRKCTREEDRGRSECTEKRDEGYQECSRREDRGYRNCCDWWPCSWACRAWVWISNVVCVAWTWLSNVVCVAWTWIKNVVCVAWVYFGAAVCALGHLGLAVVYGLAGLGGVVAGAGLRGIAGTIGKACRLFGWGGSTTTSSRLRVVGVHTAVLHTGKVLIFNYDEGVNPVTGSSPADFTAIADSDRALCAIWDPQTGTARYAHPGRNLFCSHHAFTVDGKLFVAAGQFPLPGLPKSLFPYRPLAPGADRDVHVFDPVTERWERLDDMDLGRWYPTCATMADGRIFIISGTNGWATETGMGRGIQDTYEIAEPSTRTVGSPTDLGFNIFHLYPFVHTLPSGQLFVHFKQTTAIFDTASNTFGRIAQGSAPPNRPGGTVHPFSRTGPGPGTCVLLPLEPSKGDEEGVPSYPRGRILILGGGGAEGKPDPVVPGESYGLDSYTPATDTAEILDFDDPNLEWRMVTERMHAGRVMPDTVLLPSGQVLVVGGGRFGQSGGLLAHFTSSDVGGRPNKGAWDPVFEPELFDPATETWTKLCPKPIARLYHTTAILLPDARVLVAGHDGALNMRPFDDSQYDLEIYSPPYLFDANGGLAPRPEIISGPNSARHGEEILLHVRSGNGVARLSLIRQSSTTHQINSDQRCIGLLFRENGEGGLVASLPNSGGIAPPGYYMLFVVDSEGVPSTAHWLRVGPT
jgi:hypothetical protein